MVNECPNEWRIPSNREESEKEEKELGFERQIEEKMEIKEMK